ncbi:MAG: tetratricopeptide repeat protein [Cyclobacteriaceae bacterium]|nr:tetratricopeptide repeat protein [Cyclobacteriaceae bacterium]
MTKLSLSLVILFLLHFSSFAQVSKWETEADTLMNRQQFEEATKLYSKVITTRGLKERDDYRTLYKRSVSYYYAGEFDKALKDLDVFLREFPQVAQAYVLRAFVCRELDSVDGQLTSIQKAIELQPENLELVKWRGSLLLQKNEYQLAKSDFLMVRNKLDDPELEVNLALAYYSLSDIDSALIAINKSIELDATYEPAYLYGGSLCLETEKYVKSLEYLNLALLVDPENANAIFYKGMVLVELKQEKEGCQLLARAFKAGQDDAAGYLKEHCYDIFK